jgi:uncharacterized iron-regulated protein
MTCLQLGLLLMRNQTLISIFPLLLIVSCHAPVHSSPITAPGGKETAADVHSPASGDIHAIQTSTRAVNLQQLPDLQGILPDLSRHRVVFVGEQHPRYDHHLNQLAIIRALYALDSNLAIGVEFIQQPFQPYVDKYIAGELNTQQFLRKTEYYDRWRYDFRLYAPIFEFAREHGIPMRALNTPAELTRKIGREGLEALSKEEQAQLPAEIERSNVTYREYLQRVFEQHPQGGGDFETFYEAQLVWDETMAANAASYLDEHPDARMVVLAGNGHLAYGFGIPDRVTRRLDEVSTAIVLNDWERSITPGLADYLLLSEEKELPAAGFLGIILKPADDKLKIGGFSDDSAARAAGIKKEDKLLSLNGHPVANMANVKEVMWDKKPGEEVIVKVRRSALVGEDKELTFKVELR